MAFGKTKKYKRIVKTIFPQVEGGEMQLGNISKLVYFCEMSPEQLQKVGPYIEAKAQKNLSKKRLVYVSTCIIIIRELIIGCRKHLALFSGNATRLMKILLIQTEYPSLQIEATETFIRFASVQDDSNQIPPEIDEFIKYFIIMAKNMDNDDTMRRTIRGEGLRGVTAYVSLASLTDDLDTFITKHTDIIYTILDNMQYRDQIPSPSMENRNQHHDETGETTITNVKLLATECLKDLSGRVDNMTVASLVTTIVNYLDSYQKWNFETFAVHALTSVTQSIKGQNYTIMLTSFLRHLELDHPPTVTKEIVLTSVAIVNDTTSSINMVITSLLKILVRSIENSGKHLPDVDQQFSLQNSIVESIGLIGRKIKSTSKKVEIMNQIINSLRDITKSNNSATNNLINLISFSFIQCVSQVASTLNDLVIEPSLFPLNDLASKLIEMNQSSTTSHQTKIYIQSSFQSFLIQQIQFKSLFDQLMNQQMIQFNNNDGVLEFLNNRSKPIRETVISGLKSKNNQPDNIISIFKTLIELLIRGKSKEIQYSIPMLLKLESQIDEINNNQLPIRMVRSIHLLISSYLIVVARLYRSKELEDYIEEVSNYRKSMNIHCKYLSFDSKSSSGLVIANSQKHIYSDQDQDISTLINTSTIAAATSTSSSTTTTTIATTKVTTQTTVLTSTAIEETITSEETIEKIENKEQEQKDEKEEEEKKEEDLRKDIINLEKVFEILCSIQLLSAEVPDLKIILLEGVDRSSASFTNIQQLQQTPPPPPRIITNETTTATISNDSYLSASNEVMSTTSTTTTTTTITSPMKLPILNKSRESVVLSSTIPTMFQKSLTFDSFKQFVNYFDENNQAINGVTAAANQQAQQIQNGSISGVARIERNNVHNAIFDQTFELACTKIIEAQHINKEYSDLMEILKLSEQQNLNDTNNNNTNININRAPVFIN
ncbi:hypothetical protein RB653_009289 [Dictyostelium firmibasis]|uniref:Uncharacterized protein n=1 Tax=Dictyostelium firmibasis TaxID=79012 RepID=A0AAN7YQ09_9MYCE